ncbi:hypothetical protein [Desertivirga xinjiangensis]|uniref:hypothetical protein n=1 Tax=Desertivirga xinjiangensis TaxID=539206 RepID=UPI00210B1F33|nr:hypothetical protein [Pedobacter xinjiangensis]
MNLLLPYYFKKIGATVAPLGFAVWLLMQFGFITKVLTVIFGTATTSSMASLFHTVNVILATVGFLSFLAGMYFVSFSREKVEDEMINKLRLDSFQFAAFVQLVFTIVGFLSMVILGSPNEGLLMLFFIVALFLFWLTYVARFNYFVHSNYRIEE